MFRKNMQFPKLCALLFTDYGQTPRKNSNPDLSTDALKRKLCCIYQNTVLQTKRDQCPYHTGNFLTHYPRLQQQPASSGVQGRVLTSAASSVPGVPCISVHQDQCLLIIDVMSCDRQVPASSSKQNSENLQMSLSHEGKRIAGPRR